MGNRISAVNGVRSPNFFEPGNAVNEVWLGKLEIISRLPFGDSDMAQAAWPKGDYPKIPWRPFIIPLKGTMNKVARSVVAPVSKAIRRCPTPAEMTSRWNWVDDLWILQRLLAIPFLLIPVLMHFRPSLLGLRRLDEFPNAEIADEQDLAIEARRQRKLLLSRSLLSFSCFNLGVTVLLLELIFQPCKRILIGVSVLISAEAAIYLSLILLCSYCTGHSIGNFAFYRRPQASSQ